MALLDPPGILPTAMWAVTRALLSDSKVMEQAALKRLVSPDGLPKLDTYSNAVQGLRELALVRLDGSAIALAERVRVAKPSDFESFSAFLRSSVFALDANIDLALNREQRGPRDLTRALCWFLTQDPLGEPLTWAIAQGRQTNALPKSAGLAVINDTRWNMLTHWAPALGLAEMPLSRAAGLIPDATRAVRAILREREVGQTVTADAFIADVKTHLPVLMDGQYAGALGMHTTDSLDAVTSHALLRLHDEEWLRLDRAADAASVTVLKDADGADGHRVISHVTYLGSPDA